MRGGKLAGIALLSALTLAAGTSSVAAEKPEYGYVTDSIVLPTSNAQATALGRDMTGDGNRDNKLGQVFAVLASQGADLNGLLAQAMTSGDIVMLHSLRTFSISNTKNATWQVWQGAPTLTPPDLTGSGTFELLPGQPHSSRLPATVKNHKVATASGTVPVRLDVGAGAFVLSLKRAKVVTTCFRANCINGRINGGVSQQQMDQVFIPELAQWMTAEVAQDCPGPGPASCMADSTGKTLQGIFDTDDNLTITDVELRGNEEIASLLAPDVNLVTGDDGVKDHLSFGFGFTTAKAKLTGPD